MKERVLYIIEMEVDIDGDVEAARIQSRKTLESWLDDKVSEVLSDAVIAATGELPRVLTTHVIPLSGSEEDS